MQDQLSILLAGWNGLRHGGLLFDRARLKELADSVPGPLSDYTVSKLRQYSSAMLEGAGDRSRFAAFVLEHVCGLDGMSGTWSRGSNVAPSWRRRAVTGESVKPSHLWIGPRDAQLPVFLNADNRLGIGRSRRTISQALGWLRAGDDSLALVTNGRQWRLLFAGLDYEAWCEWELDLWFKDGELSSQVDALRTLLQSELWTPAKKNAAPRILKAIRATRKGQADLSEALGERVRNAVEILIQGHAEALSELDGTVSGADIYRAACRVAMRLVIILFAESRDLLPRDNPLYYESYGLDGLFRQLEHRERRRDPLAESFAAWPRILSLCRLVRDGSHHPEMPLNAYGGELFAAGEPDSEEGVSRALAIFENACFERRALPDSDVYRILQCLTRTTITIRQGRGSIKVPVPVDFSDLSSEYIGVLYEGLLDYELKTAPPDDPVIFLAVGDQPALPLQALEALEDCALKALFKDLGKAENVTDDDERDDEASYSQDASWPEPETAFFGLDDTKTDQDGTGEPDERQRHRTRAETWARRAAVAAGLVKKPRGRRSAERQLALDQEVNETAQRLVGRVVLPGEWYLIRWGGTRKGSGSFYTRPGLAVPTVQRTLRPLAYDPPAGSDGAPNLDARPAQWTPKLPEEILSLTVCDPACGSGTFPLAALRFLTDALYASVQYHSRIRPDGNRSLVRLLGLDAAEGPDSERLSDELIPCPSDDDNFEARLKAVLRRHVVERCLYAVDLDPLAIELCRLSLWIETMDRNLPFGFLDHKVKCGNSLIGTWFDYFRHYPAMAWKNREGGDKNHSNGVHFTENARTYAIKTFWKEKLTPDLKQFLQGRDLFHEDLLEEAAATHRDAFAALEKMHALPAHDTLNRSRIYRTDFLGSTSWQSLKEAMDLWCACWFWPVDEIGCAPVPTNFLKPPVDTQTVARRVAVEMRFFHWELEFPDVFRDERSGFDAMLGNPPWDTAKPVSKEFFTNIDPLYRSYGKQEALRRQSGYFADLQVESNWLDYNGAFRAQSNFVSFAARPFGDPDENDNSRYRFTIVRGLRNIQFHSKWRKVRQQSNSFCDCSHPFQHQGSADINLFKLFLEVAHVLLRNPANGSTGAYQRGGRLGFVVPSGLFSDNGTQALRDLFLEHCQWWWLFGIVNHHHVFPIHSSYKFNPIIVEKGGTTKAIRTVFMRRDLTDWENAEKLDTPYPIEQIRRFSPRNHAILEIQSQHDLEILDKIYDDAVLIDDTTLEGWNIQYATEFHSTGDSKLFPPRQEWEERGYRPDEYNRWILGNWRHIEELYATLNIEALPAAASRPEKQIASALEDWLFVSNESPARRQAKAKLLHGHLLKPGDVERTEWISRCARQPYDRLPVPRVVIPAGIVLSREVDAWIDETEIEDIALPLYEGRMVGQFDFSKKGWLSGKGRTAVWRDNSWENKEIIPQFLMSQANYTARVIPPNISKCSHMRVASATNSRTAISSALFGIPANDKAAVFYSSQVYSVLGLNSIMNSLVFDFITRVRLTGLGLDYHVLKQNALPKIMNSTGIQSLLVEATSKLNLTSTSFSLQYVQMRECADLQEIRHCFTDAERIRVRSILDAVMAVLYSLNISDVRRIIRDCDWPTNTLRERGFSTRLDPKGFWRIHQDRDPELRHPVLMFVAFCDLNNKIEKAGGIREKGIETFYAQNSGEGWMLPESLRLSDYGLGHDKRAETYQPVASRLGPRFYDWQLAQHTHEFWRECHLHSRNMLGKYDYASFLAESAMRRAEEDTDGGKFLMDQFAHKLICDDSWVAVLEAIHAKQVWKEQDFWAAVASLHDEGQLSNEDYRQLLESLSLANPNSSRSSETNHGNDCPAKSIELTAESGEARASASAEIVKRRQLYLFDEGRQKDTLE